MRPTLLLALLLTGCSAESGIKFDSDGAFGDAAETDFDTGRRGGGGGNGEPDEADTLPDEQEEDRKALRPQQTPRYLFIPNLDRDTITRVDTRTLDVITHPVGRRPRAIGVTPDQAMAVVFNQRDNTVQLLDAEALTGPVVSVRPNLNQLVISPDGGTAALFHDVGATRPDDPVVTGAVSFNEISLVDLDTATHVPLVVGFNPKAIRFTPDGATALVIADGSLATVDLTGSTPTARFIAIADPLDPPPAEEVVVEPTGAYAFVRQGGVNAITVVGLRDGSVDLLPVGAGPTDLDLSADGSRTIVVSRASRQITVFDALSPYAPPRIIPTPVEATLGSLELGPDDRGVLFSNATSQGRYATWSVDSDVVGLRGLPKPVESLALTPTGEGLIITHPPGDNPDGSTPVPYRNRYALSLVSFEDGRANTLALDAVPNGSAASADGRYGYVILEGRAGLAVLDFRTLIADAVALPSQPVFVGVLPDDDVTDDDQPAAWVSQDHPLGRLTFYDPDDGVSRTLTGFELNSQIED